MLLISLMKIISLFLFPLFLLLSFFASFSSLLYCLRISFTSLIYICSYTAICLIVYPLLSNVITYFFRPCIGNFIYLKYFCHILLLSFFYSCFFLILVSLFSCIFIVFIYFSKKNVMLEILFYLIIQQLYIFSRISFDEEIFAFFYKMILYFRISVFIPQYCFQTALKILSNLLV